MSDEQFNELLCKIDDVKNSSCGFITSLLVLFILFGVMTIPSDDEVREIIKQELQSKAQP